MGHLYRSKGQIDKRIQTLEIYRQTYPADSTPLSGLASEYARLGRFDEQLKYSLEGIRLGPNSGPFGYTNAAAAYMGLNRLDEAKTILGTALERKVGGISAHFLLSLIALAQGDRAAQEREDAMIRSSAGGESWLLFRDAGLAALRGQIRQSRELLIRTKDADQLLNLKESAVAAVVSQGAVEASYGYTGQAEKTVAAALSMSPGWAPTLSIARVFALIGNEQKASALAKEVASRRTEDTWVQSVSVPGIQTILELRHGNPGKALELLNAAKPYDRADSDTLLIRGTAYLKAEKGTEAALEFQKILNLRNWYPEFSLALAQLGLARAYIAQGDVARARAAYQDLLALWKDADPDVPLVKEAKSEYAKLQ